MSTLTRYSRNGHGVLDRYYISSCIITRPITFTNFSKIRFEDIVALLWRHSGRDGVSNHQPHDCLLDRSFRCKSKQISKLCVTGLCAGNSSVTGEFPAQKASNAKNVSIWWHHHGKTRFLQGFLLLTSCNFNPSMNKLLYQLWSLGMHK